MHDASFRTRERPRAARYNAWTYRVLCNVDQQFRFFKVLDAKILVDHRLHQGLFGKGRHVHFQHHNGIDNTFGVHTLRNRFDLFDADIFFRGEKDKELILFVVHLFDEDREGFAIGMFAKLHLELSRRHFTHRRGDHVPAFAQHVGHGPVYAEETGRFGIESAPDARRGNRLGGVDDFRVVVAVGRTRRILHN
jgi:hypothetical protein